MEHIIDLRSDTCSWPDEEMRAAIAAAPVGNDSWGEDPSVTELERLAAEVTGKEAALFCASGTMANLTAGITWAKRHLYASEIMLAEYSHSYWYEVGGLSTIAGLTFRPVPCGEEYLTPEKLQAALRPASVHMPQSRILWLENTFMLGGGVAIELAKMRELQQFANAHKLNVHLDGARIFNAAANLGCQVADIAAFADSVQFCLSKGLGAPYGSLLCGDKVFIEEAKRHRQVLGGGMRQIGMMAKAGTVGIRRALERGTIARDNALAAKLATGINALSPGAVSWAPRSTNLVLVRPAAFGKTAEALRDQLLEKGIRPLIVPTAQGPACRMMTYPNLTDGDIETVLQAFRESVLAH